MAHWSDNDLSGSEREIIRKAKPKPMLIPTKRQMRDINERVTDIGNSLMYWREETQRFGLFKTAQAISEAARVFGEEAEQAQRLFNNSGRRRRGRN